MEISTSSTLFQIEDSLGSLELEIMQIVWKRNRTTVREVLNVLNQKKTIAYTTVMTVMDHLRRKNFLRREKNGKTYYYQPVISSNAAISSSFSSVFKFLVSNYGPRKVLSSAVTSSFSPKIKFPFISSYITSTKYSLFLTLCLTIFGLSLADLFENLKFFGALDYLNLFTSEPAIFWDKVHLAIFAIVESLPIINILTTIVSFILMIYIVKRLIRLFNFPTRVSL